MAEPKKNFAKIIAIAIVIIFAVGVLLAFVFLLPQKTTDNHAANDGNGNLAPTALFVYNPSLPTIEDTIIFSNKSTDNDGIIISYRWDFGDGTTSNEKDPAHQYSEPDNYLVRLTVTDNGGKTGTFSMLINVGGTGESVFQDFELNNGTPGAYFYNAWRSSSAFETNTVHRGNRSIKVVVPPVLNEAYGATIGINAASSTRYIDLSNATEISVWVYDTQGNNTIELKLKDLTGNIGAGVWSDRSATWNEWTKITWDISNYQGVVMSRIASIELYEWNEGTYYFDTIVYR
ncbi:MAG: PKD domain-containing protein [Candidatus Hadarchaeales archaeon]